MLEREIHDVQINVQRMRIALEEILKILKEKKDE